MTAALDLFAGAGGWSLACERLGVDETGVEIMPEAVATRAAAGFKTHEVGDVWEFDFAAARGSFDGLIASPPCQTFSTAGKGKGREALDVVVGTIKAKDYRDMESLKAVGRAVGDERTALVLTPLHAAYEMRPEWIAWEQVPTVLPVWEACAEDLRSWGYSVWTGNLQAEQYGVPQTRKRAFLIAHRERAVAPPVPTHSRYYSRSPEQLDPGVQKWVSMAEALLLNDIVDPASGDPAQVALRSNYGTGGDASNRGERRLGEPSPTITSKVDRNKWVYRRPAPTIVGTFRPEVVAADGSCTIDQPAYTIRAQGSGSHPSGVEWVYRASNQAHAAKRPLDEPAPTVNFGARSNKVEWMPEGAASDPKVDGVRVTVQEAGILQSFPADFAWQGPKTKKYLQCGNAVPPLLAEAVLRTVV